MTNNRNLYTALSLAGIVFGMVLLAYASVPLYRLFCQITGIGGTTQASMTAPDTMLDRVVTVRFNADMAPSMPWQFRPLQSQVTVHIGEQKLVAYTAENQSDKALVGVATYNVTPFKVGPYFNKIQCFCFENQLLNPGQQVNMPISFFIDPAFAEDPDMRDVHTITLSYTFFRAKDQDVQDQASLTPQNDVTE